MRALIACAITLGLLRLFFSGATAAFRSSTSLCRRRSSLRPGRLRVRARAPGAASASSVDSISDMPDSPIPRLREAGKSIFDSRFLTSSRMLKFSSIMRSSCPRVVYMTYLSSQVLMTGDLNESPHLRSKPSICAGSSPEVLRGACYKLVVVVDVDIHYRSPDPLSSLLLNDSLAVASSKNTTISSSSFASSLDPELEGLCHASSILSSLLAFISFSRFTPVRVKKLDPAMSSYTNTFFISGLAPDTMPSRSRALPVIRI